jgi:ribonuclease HI
MSQNTKLKRAEILEGLVELSDQALQDVVPYYSPAFIRETLKKAAKLFRQPPPVKQKSTPDKKEDILSKKVAGSTLYLYTDGASRGNPGEAGAGVLITDNMGQEIFTKGFYLGHCTNNEAEYKALIIGLAEASGSGCDNIVIFLDSQLIVRQINGEYQVKNKNLIPLYGQVTELLSFFNKYRIEHIPRSENTRADQLANQGIDMKEK